MDTRSKTPDDGGNNGQLPLEREDRFFELFEGLPVGAAVYRAVDGGEDFVFLHLNRAGEAFAGMSREQVAGKRITEMFPGIREFGLIETMRSVWKSGVPEIHPLSDYRDGRVSLCAENNVFRLSSGEVVCVFRDLSEHQSTRQALREREQYLTGIFSAAPIGMGVVADRVFVEINQSFCGMLGYPYEEIVGKGTRMVFCDDDEYTRFGRQKETDLRERGASILETVWKRKDGRELNVLVSVAVFDRKQVNGGEAFTAMDITERKRSEEAAISALKEKEVLLREVNHRVKNNLQIINSLFNLQAEKLKDANAKEVFRENTGRIRLIAMVHEKLYQSRDFSRIDLAGYLRSLVDSLVSYFGIDPRHIRMSIDVDPAIILEVDKLISCGLVVNELVTNSFKYAFPGERRGSITISFRLEEGEPVLRVCDDGAGFPQGFDLKESQTLGLELVRSLAGQLGEFRLDGSRGVRFSLTLKERKKR